MKINSLKIMIIVGLSFELLTGCQKQSQQVDIEQTETMDNTSESEQSVTAENMEGQQVTVPDAADQIYVYSEYCDIGQLGEEGIYYSSDYPTGNEVVIFETTADITHDGIDDLVRVSGYTMEEKSTVEEVINNSSEGCFIKLFRGLADGSYENQARFISRNYHSCHAGNGTICLSHKDGQDYLLLSSIYEIQGTATYDFAAIYVDDETGIVIDDTYGVEFAVWEEEHQNWDSKMHRDDVVPVFEERISPYTEDSIILMSLNVDSEPLYSTSEHKCESSEFFDTVWARDY